MIGGDQSALIFKMVRGILSKVAWGFFFITKRVF
jgi:hypothetical protein